MRAANSCRRWAHGLHRSTNFQLAGHMARIAPSVSCVRFNAGVADAADASKTGAKGSIFGSVNVSKDGLDLSHLLTQSQWSSEELDAVEIKHREPTLLVDKLAYRSVQLMRLGFDILSGYKIKKMTGGMRERDWLRRVIFLETVAGVPGMVGGMARHLRSLRLMKRDNGWIHSLLSEAENERMHLLIALNLRRPGPVFRAFVIAAQGIFVAFYTIAYCISPRYCHRFVGYLEEEAVVTYTGLVEDIDNGNLGMFSQMRAPRMARTYYHLPDDAMLRDVFACIRADEGAHRDTNHHFGDLKPDDPNTKVEHLRKHHFSTQGALSGVVYTALSKREDNLREAFKQLDINNSGYITMDNLKEVMNQQQAHFTEKEIQLIFDEADKNHDGQISYTEFVSMVGGEK